MVLEIGVEFSAVEDAAAGGSRLIHQAAFDILIGAGVFDWQYNGGINRWGVIGGQVSDKV